MRGATASRHPPPAVGTVLVRGRSMIARIRSTVTGGERLGKLCRPLHWLIDELRRIHRGQPAHNGPPENALKHHQRLTLRRSAHLRARHLLAEVLDEDWCDLAQLVWLTAAGYEGHDLAPVKAPAVVLSHHTPQRRDRLGSRQRRTPRPVMAVSTRTHHPTRDLADHGRKRAQRPQPPTPPPRPLATQQTAPGCHRPPTALPTPTRQPAALQGWQAAIAAGRYAQIRYQTSPILAYDLHRLAAQVGLDPPALIVGENMTAPELYPPATVTEDDTTPPAAVEQQPAPTYPPPTPDVGREPGELRQWRSRPRKLPSANARSTSYSESANPSPGGDGRRRSRS